MTISQRIIFNWSGGKDAALALYKLMMQEADIMCLLTSFSERYQRVSMHGVRMELMEAQAASIGLPLVKMIVPDVPSMDNYEKQLVRVLSEWRELGADTCAYGDIFLEDLKQYREQKLSLLDMQAIFPIWKIPTKELVHEFIDLGFKAIVVCVDAKHLDKSFAGRLIDHQFLQDLPAGVDVCGENGEFHSFVFDGPIFKTPIPVSKGEIVYREYKDENADSTINAGFWYCDLLLA